MKKTLLFIDTRSEAKAERVNNHFLRNDNADIAQWSERLLALEASDRLGSIPHSFSGGCHPRLCTAQLWPPELVQTTAQHHTRLVCRRAQLLPGEPDRANQAIVVQA